MNRRTLALVAAVITFGVGVALARLSLPNLFTTRGPAPQKEIEFSHYRISGPYAFENLSVFLIHGPDGPNHFLYTPLEEAMERNIVIVHETSDVIELEIENISANEEVFVQAGDIVRGGRQDRVLSVDLILPPHSGRIPISAYCVEQHRWQPREFESGDQFTLTEMTVSYSLRQIIKDAATQLRVWDKVDDEQRKLTVALPHHVRSSLSPSSLALSLETQPVRESVAPYVENLLSLAKESNDVIGVAFAVDDELIGADVYHSHWMFKRYWPRLLKAAAVQAVAASVLERESDGLAIEKVAASLVSSERGVETVSKINDRTQSAKRETEDGLFFETRDIADDGAWVHRSYLVRSQGESQQIN